MYNVVLHRESSYSQVQSNEMPSCKFGMLLMGRKESNQIKHSFFSRIDDMWYYVTAKENYLLTKDPVKPIIVI